MAKSWVRVKDNGYNKIMKFAERVGGGALSVGIHREEGLIKYQRSGQTISQVAAWHESGTKTMPARPFFTFWFDQKNGARRIRDSTREALDWALRTGNDPTKRLERLGERYVGQIRETFLLMTALAESTARRKGSRRKLYDTGAMYRAIGYRVRLERPKRR